MPAAVKGLPIKKEVPQNPEELNEALGKYFSAKRKLKGLKTRLGARLQKIKDQYGLKMKPVEEEIKMLSEGIQISSEAHRAEFTADGTKSRKFRNGTVGWRLGNWKHIISTSDEEIIAQLKEKGLYDKYVIVTEELDVQKLVRDRDALRGQIDGLSFDQEERFYIDPPKAKKA